MYFRLLTELYSFNNQGLSIVHSGIAGEAQLRSEHLYCSLGFAMNFLPIWPWMSFSFSVFICRRRQSFKSLPALASWELGSLDGKDTETPVSCCSVKGPHAVHSGKEFLLSPISTVETEAWMYELPNVELSSSSTLFFLLLIQGQRGS